MIQEETADLICARQEAIAEAVVSRHFKLRPELELHYGAKGRQKCLQDTEYHCLHLAGAVRFEEEALFLDYVAWAKVLLCSIGIKEADLRDNLELLLAAMREVLPGAFHETACHYLESAIRQLPQMASTVEPFVQTNVPHGELAKAYLNHLLAREGREAKKLVWEAVEEGMPLPDMYHYVIVPCLQDVGRLWQTHHINEALEHYCTETTQDLLAILSVHFNPSAPRRIALGFCVAGERHLLGIRMALDCLQLQGWDTVCLGGDVPTRNVESILQTWLPDSILVSATMVYHLAELRNVISAIRATSVPIKPTVLVGGRPFEISPELWRKVGADAPSGSCSEAIRLAQTVY